MFGGREPALIIGLINAALALAVSFGLSLTVEQTGAILAFFNIAAAVWTRSQVTPTAKAEEAIDKAFNATPGLTPKPTL